MLTLPTHEVHVWWADYRLADDAWLDLLSPGERARFDAYRRSADRARFLMGTVLVRSLFALELHVPAGAVPLERYCPDCERPHGKVRLAPISGDPNERIEVSISHSGQWVAMAACRRYPIGVDVECVDRDADHRGLARIALTATETRCLTALVSDDQPGAFTRYWVCKEAVVKATGEGLRAPLTDLEISPPECEPAVVAWPHRPDLLDRLRLYDLAYDNDYRAAVAVLDAPTVRVVQSDARQLLALHS